MNQKKRKIRNKSGMLKVAIFTILTLGLINYGYCENFILDGADKELFSQIGEGSSVQKVLYGVAFVGSVIFGLVQKNIMSGVIFFVSVALFLYIGTSLVLN